MARLALVGTIEIAPGRRDQLISSTMARKARCLRDEPGTLRMEVLAPRGDDTKVLVYEVYGDDRAFDVHRSGSSLAQWGEETAGMIIKFSVTRCTPVESGPSLTRT